MTSVEREIVRVADVDLDGRLPVYEAIQSIRGIGYNLAVMIHRKFFEITGLPSDTPIGNIPEDKVDILQDMIYNPSKYGIPNWALNTRKEWETGEDKHYVGVDLEVKERNILKRLADLGTYRGLRRMWGLKVRGQRTKSKGRKNKISPRIRKKR